MYKIVLALGGNALGDSPEEQREIVKETAKMVASLAKENYKIAIVHGNGPQVGMIFNAFDLANKQDKKISSMPLPECGALSQGYIGFSLQQAIDNEFKHQNINRKVATIVTQTIVDKNDAAFQNPSKPIGPFMSEDLAKQISNSNIFVKNVDAKQGWRRVVASPKPINFVEKDTIKNLFEEDVVVICAGGGGIPTYLDNNTYIDVAAVIDKDFAAAKLSELLDADKFIILTNVDAVKINYNQPNEKSLHEESINSLNVMIKENQFAAGSMLPKIQACMQFASTGKSAYIGALSKCLDVFEGKSGTKIIK